MFKFLVTLLIVCMSAVPALAEVAMETVWEMHSGRNEVATSVHVDHNRFGLDLGVRAIGEMTGANSLQLSVEELGLSYRADRLDVFGGLLRHNIGQARLNQVFLSDSSPAFPSIGYAIGGDTWSYTKMLGVCGPMSAWSVPLRRSKNTNGLASIISGGSRLPFWRWDLLKRS